MNWTDRRVLVTGAGGFIGSHLTERLVEEGAQVRAFVHYNALGSWGWLDRSALRDQMEVVQGNVEDRDGLRKAMVGVEVVFHLAALISIPYSYQAPGSYVRTNIEGTLNVLQLARELDISRIVQTSTSEVYGSARYVPIDEDHPLQAQSPYAASKIAADKLAEAFHLSFDLPVVIVRPFNTFGPRQSARAVIPTIISQCQSGGRVHLGNLHPTRDLNFVSNTVAGFLRAGWFPQAIGRVINLGSGREVSIGDLAQLIIKLTSQPVEIEIGQERIRPANSEVDRLLAKSDLARDLLGWKPDVSLEEGLRLTIEWITEHPDNYRPERYTI